MSAMAVKTVTSTNQALHRFRQSAGAIHDEIQRRAYYLYLQNGCREGHDMEDWLEAERDVLCAAPGEVTETQQDIEIQAALPDVDSRTLEVDVLPDWVAVEGRAEHGEKRLLRRFDLAARIDPDGVTATLEDGVLKIVARKAAAAPKAAAQRAAA
jgi:HSP20 family molecular chaperone IbpA